LCIGLFFPLNDQPRGLWTLLERFQHGAEVKDFVRQHLLAGATAALVFVRAHYPALDFAKLGHGAPRYVDGEPEDLRPHYDAVDGAAKTIVSLIESEMKT
jgi:hypothetical protein